MAEKHKPGFVEKIKEKLPGHHEKPDLSGEDPVEETVNAGTITDMFTGEVPGIPAVALDKSGTAPAEEKSTVQKVKDKLPGHHVTGTGIRTE